MRKPEQPGADWIGRFTGETQGKLLRILRRSNHTINELAAALGLTDNAVRLHVAALERDGIVADVGSIRGGWKPARVYGLTKQGEELFPKAYALVLGELVEEIVRSDGAERAVELLRSVGARVGAEERSNADAGSRVDAAANVLRHLGGDVDVERTETGWRLRGYGCPLSAVTSGHASVCHLAKALVEEITGRPVVECCERGDRPRCAFAIGGTQ